jgi:hypothetical protein
MHLVDRKTTQRMPQIIKLRVRHLYDSFQKRCKITTFLEYMQVFEQKNVFFADFLLVSALLQYMINIC